MTVRSATKPPAELRNEVDTTPPSCPTASDCTPASAPGPDTSKMANADRSTIAQVSRIARCSALTTGDHQRESHSAVRPSTWYFSSSPAFDSYQNGRSQPAVS